MDFQKLAEGLAAFRKEAKAPRYIRELMRTGQKAKTRGARKYIDEVKKGKELSSDFKARLPKHEGRLPRWDKTDRTLGVFEKNPDLAIRRNQISSVRAGRKPQTQTLADAIGRRADKKRKLETAGVKGKFKAFRRALRGESTTPKADLWERNKLRKLTDATMERSIKASRKLRVARITGKDSRKLYNQRDAYGDLHYQASRVRRRRSRARENRKKDNALLARLALNLGAGTAAVGAGYGGYRVLRKRKRKKSK